MRNPVVCNKGHTMCEKCLERAMFKGSGNCPVDRTFVGAVLSVRNLALQSMIDKLQMKSPNEAGCSWNGPLEKCPTAPERVPHGNGQMHQYGLYCTSLPIRIKWTFGEVPPPDQRLLALWR